MALTKAERLARARQYRALRKARRSAPGMMARIADPSIPDHELTPVERGCRGLRDSVYEQAGGRARLLQTHVMRVEVLMLKYLMVTTGAGDVLPVLERHGTMSLRTLKMHPAVVDLDRLLSSYEKTLDAVERIKQGQPAEDWKAKLDREGAAEVEWREADDRRRIQEDRALRAAQGVQVETRPELTSMPAPEALIVEPGSSGPGQRGGDELVRDLEVPVDDAEVVLPVHVREGVGEGVGLERVAEAGPRRGQEEPVPAMERVLPVLRDGLPVHRVEVGLDEPVVATPATLSPRWTKGDLDLERAGYRVRVVADGSVQRDPDDPVGAF